MAARAGEQRRESTGYACQTTAYGEEAVELATDGHFDLILLDIMLPDIDGYEVLRRLQAAHVSTPVLIQSGIIGRDEMDTCVTFGVEASLVKPFTLKRPDEPRGTALGADRAAPLAADARRPGGDAHHDGLAATQPIVGGGDADGKGVVRP